MNRKVLNRLSNDYLMYSFYLHNIKPDPDKIFQQYGCDYNLYRDLLVDPHLVAAVQQRKMQILQMGWEINGPDIALNRELLSLFENLSLTQYLNYFLDCFLYGFSVCEIIWSVDGGKLIPVDLIYKPQEYFGFDKDNNLVMREGSNIGYNSVYNGLPPYKILLCQYQANHQNPYGEKLLNKCYWPVNVKAEIQEYWQTMVERFGAPYVLGTYPLGAVEPNISNFLEACEDLMTDGCGVVEDGYAIDLKSSPQYNVGQTYMNIISYYNKEISKAILTVTLTMEIERVGSYKAAEIHKEMLEYIAISDKKICEKALNTMIEYYCQLNYGLMSGFPKIKFNKKETIIESSIERDNKLRQMGVVFTKQYYNKRYNLQDNDFDIE